MTLSEIPQALRSYGIYSLIVFILALIIGYITIILTPKTYQASSSITATYSFANSPTSNDLYQARSYTVNQVPTYAQEIKSDAVLLKTISNFDLKEDVSSLSSKIQVNTINMTSSLNITAIDSDPNYSMQLANALASSAVEYLNNTNRSNNIPVTIQVSHSATIPVTPTTPNKKKNITSAFIFGVGISFSMIIYCYINDVPAFPKVKKPRHH